MAWTYADVKTAIAALNPMPADNAGIADALNAQTHSINRDISVSAVQKVLVPTGELFAVNQIAAKPLSGTNPPTQEDQVTVAAWALSRMLDRWEVIETSQDAVWTDSLRSLNGLMAANVLTSASVNAISALRTVAAPVWDPPLTVGDIQTAKAQP